MPRGKKELVEQISVNSVSMNGNPHTVSLCLETIWNSPNSTTEGYRAVGANLAAAVREYRAERPERNCRRSEMFFCRFKCI